MEDLALKIYKEKNKRIFDPEKRFDKDDVELEFSDKSSIYNSIGDGISILDVDLNVLSVNFTLRSWYTYRKSFIGKKCYYVYHNRSKPCENCPILKTLSDGKAHYDIVACCSNSNSITKWHELQSYPICKDGQIVGVVEYVKDITRDVALNYEIFCIEHSLMDFRVQNDVLKNYLEEIKNSNSQLFKNLSINIKKYVKPLMEQIKYNSQDKPSDYQLVCLLDSIFGNITKPYLEASKELENFTSQEIQIMSMIKGGRSSKEIAEKLRLSIKTIDFHRTNIRKKLNIGRTDNLRAHIMQLFVTLESL